MEKKYLKSATLLEAVVAIVILAMTMAALANLFVASRRMTLHSRSRMAGGELGRTFLDPLQSDVRQDQWLPPLPLQNCLSSNGAIGCLGVQVIGNITYTPAYAITQVVTPAGTVTDLRRVQLTIRWIETPP